MKLAAALLLAAGAVMAQPRPQLDDAAAARHRVEDYLGDWKPAAIGSAKPDFVVARDGSGTHRSLQSALDALPPAGARRHVIRVMPGTYRETVCVQGKAPFTLLGDPADAGAAVIVAGHWNAERKRPGIDSANPCEPSLDQATFGTGGSASVALFGDDLEVAFLTIENDAMKLVREGQGYPPGAGESGGAQGVALMTKGDRIRLHGVRLLGHQDTLYARGGRTLVTESLIAGDVDFIFGDATLVIDRSTILSRAGRRKPGNGGHVLAPNTPPDRALGFLVANSRLLAEPGVEPASISLGRAWDFGVPAGQWKAGVSPNGQALIRDSELGAHLAPWAASTSRRPFDASTHRLFEYRNTALPAVRDLAREVLPAFDGWAAADGGTRGGADAADADVHEVRTRAELAAALRPHARPRIVKVMAMIDLAADAAGRSQGFDDFREPGFSWEAYVADVEGPQEALRRRSAQRQTAAIVQRVPSNTTIVGAAPGAGFRNGMLLLERVDNVIVRHLVFHDAYDHFPQWDPKDNGHGEWNSDYDNLSLREATRVWIDHNSFDDGERADPQAVMRLGRRVQHHDGLLDITRQSNHVTVSWNVFRRHDKTTLVGSGDGVTADNGRLKVTFHHNWYDRVMERTPRVRFGEVHVFNNLFTGQADGDYPYGYSIGIGLQSKVVSERNVWQVPEGRPPVRVLKGTAFVDRGSLVNGRPADFSSLGLAAEVGWVPSLVRGLDRVEDVEARVRSGAGAGR